MPNAPEGYLVFRTESLYNLQHVKWRYIIALHCLSAECVQKT